MTPATTDSVRASAYSANAARGRLKSDALQRLTTSAMELFIERGYDDVTVSEISAMSGVTTRTFFRYFPTKESVITDGYDATNQRWVDIIGELPEEISARAAVRQSVVQWLQENQVILGIYSSIAAGSASLLGAVMSRSITWELRLGEAFGAKVPELDGVSARYWAMIALGTARIAREVIVGGDDIDEVVAGLLDCFPR